MAFLDNSGDIILDAVLTDEGRRRLARANGSFRITKFALGDEEIDYANYNKNHASGSAYYDLEILQTPVMESFTNNTSTMKTNLLTYSRADYLHLPVLKMNESTSRLTARYSGDSGSFGRNTFLVLVDEDTQNDSTILGASLSTEAERIAARAGIIFGSPDSPVSGLSGDAGSYVRVDQGLDTTEIAPTRRLSPELVESAYSIVVDNRLGSIISVDTATRAALNTIDDDNFANYSLSLSTDESFVFLNTETRTIALSNDNPQTIAGPRGTVLRFRVLASEELNSSNYYFDTLGQNGTLNGVSVKYIDSFVRVQGLNSGFSLDIPVRFVKKA